MLNLGIQTAINRTKKLKEDEIAEKEAKRKKQQNIDVVDTWKDIYSRRINYNSNYSAWVYADEYSRDAMRAIKKYANSLGYATCLITGDLYISWHPNIIIRYLQLPKFKLLIGLIVLSPVLYKIFIG